MGNIKLDYSKTLNFIRKEDIFGFENQVKSHIHALYNKTGIGNDYLGWVNLPTSITFEEIEEINQTANVFKSFCEVVVVLGIGGSYLGSRAIINALTDTFSMLKERKNPLVVFAGQNISEDFMYELRQMLSNYSWGIIAISKSGTTTEPALALRILKADIEEKYGKDEAARRIVAITDASKGGLRTLATKKGYKTFIIPDDVGGRYSLLTPVGLLPIAIAGFDIAQLVKGAFDMQQQTKPEVSFKENPAALYAATRNALLQSGKEIEILANYNPKLHYVAEWWKQLYGESEGKENKGIFPASVDFTTDLHSMGQYIQEGKRNLFETVISIAQPNTQVVINNDDDNLDGLNYLAGKRMDHVSKMAKVGTILAHVDGGVPNIRIDLPLLNEYYLGQLMYFYEMACGISGYILNVNPFDQPGVEAYKKNMFALLEKPGFEEETKAIKAKL